MDSFKIDIRKYILLIFLVMSISSNVVKADMLIDQRKTLELQEQCEEYLKSGTKTLKGQQCETYIFGFLDARYMAWSATPGGIEKWKPYLFCIPENTTIIAVIENFLDYNQGWTKNIENMKYLGLSAALSDKYPCFKHGKSLFPE